MLLCKLLTPITSQKDERVAHRVRSHGIAVLRDAYHLGLRWNVDPRPRSARAAGYAAFSPGQIFSAGGSGKIYKLEAVCTSDQTSRMINDERRNKAAI